MGPPKRTARPAAGAARPAAKAPAAARKVLRVESMQRFYRSLRRCEKMRPKAGVGKLKRAPPLQANELQWWGMLSLSVAGFFVYRSRGGPARKRPAISAGVLPASRSRNWGLRAPSATLGCFFSAAAGR